MKESVCKMHNEKPLFLQIPRLFEAAIYDILKK